MMLNVYIVMAPSDNKKYSVGNLLTQVRFMFI